MGLTSEDVKAYIEGGFDINASQEEKWAHFRRLIGTPATRQIPTPEQISHWKQQDAQTVRAILATGKAIPADPDHFESPSAQGPTPDQTMGRSESNPPE